MRRMRVAVAALLLWTCPPAAGPESLTGLPASTTLQGWAEVKQLAPGKFLVARRDLPDPNFVETVVLLIHYDKKGAMGLIVNRPTDIPVSRLFKEAARNRADFVYLGGPVAQTGVLALLRSETKPEEARPVFADVYLVSSRRVLEKALSAGETAGRLRVYLGYSGWAAGQLEREVERGSWHVLVADAPTVFDPDPDTVWLRLIRRTELRWAFAQPAAERFSD